MSTDRELELAAKAANIELDGECQCGGFWVWDEDRLHHLPWNPRTDDGDAFRLAISCGIELEECGDRFNACIDTAYHRDLAKLHGGCVIATATIVDGDKVSAARLAILRAGAEIGRQMVAAEGAKPC